MGSNRKKKQKQRKGIGAVNTIGGGAPSPFAGSLNIGAAAAENDGYLSACFIRTEDYGTMQSIADRRCILVGRTGIGKSALITHLRDQQDNVVDISPDEMSLFHICNSDVLKFCEEAGANLDMLYASLWRNVIVTEVLKHKYVPKSTKSTKGLFDWIARKIEPQDKNAEVAHRYIKELEGMFSDEEGFKVQEFTKKWEADLRGGFSKIPGIPLNAEGAVRLSEEQRGQVVHHSQNILGQMHMKTMANVIQWMSDDVFTDQQQRYYVTIDRLDEGWAPTDTLRLNLIRALIESVKAFGKIKPLKVIIALRTDLLESVYAATSARGYQEEKHRDFHLYVRWSSDNIKEMLDKRIQNAKKGPDKEFGHYLKGFMPQAKNKRSAIDYMINRTLMRPRDAIMFLNNCLEAAQNRERLTWANMLEAEKTYSQGRLVSLAEEWRDVYPCVRGYTKVLRGLPVSFNVEDIPELKIQQAFLEMCDMPLHKDDSMVKKFSEDMGGNHRMLCRELVAILYKVGVIGIKKNPSDAVSYSYDTDYPLPSDEVQDDAPIWVHPAFRRCLGIQDREG